MALSSALISRAMRPITRWTFMILMARRLSFPPPRIAACCGWLCPKAPIPYTPLSRPSALMASRVNRSIAHHPDRRLPAAHLADGMLTDQREFARLHHQLPPAYGGRRQQLTQCPPD